MLQFFVMSWSEYFVLFDCLPIMENWGHWDILVFILKSAIWDKNKTFCSIFFILSPLQAMFWWCLFVFLSLVFHRFLRCVSLTFSFCFATIFVMSWSVYFLLFNYLLIIEKLGHWDIHVTILRSAIWDKNKTFCSIFFVLSPLQVWFRKWNRRLEEDWYSVW